MRRAGISAVIVYPMNALAEDQLMRLRSLLAGTGVSFGMYVGKTPEREGDVVGVRLPPASSQADYEAQLEATRKAKSGESVFPTEEACSREAMRSAGGQPRILLTNVKQLELLLTRQRDAELFHGARLDYLVFDEAHTFTGAMGAETACLVRRLRAFCGRQAADTVCVATSATIVDRDRPEAARAFASRFFGVPEESVETVAEDYEEEVWSEERWLPAAPPDGDTAEILADCVKAVDDDSDGPGDAVRDSYRALAGRDLDGETWPEALYEALARSEIVYRLNEALHEPRPLHELPPKLQEAIGREITEAEILAWLTLAAAARRDGRPLLRPVVHGFVRGIPGAVVSFPNETDEPRLWLAAEDEIEHGESAPAEETEPSGEARSARLPVLTCTTCGQHYYEAHLEDFSFTGKRPGGGEPHGDGVVWRKLDEAREGKRVVLVDRLIGGDEHDVEAEEGPGQGRRDGNSEAASVLERRTAPVHFCRYCGAAHERPGGDCLACGAPGPRIRLHAVRQKKDRPGVLTSCLSCNALGGRGGGGHYREPARPVRASNAADVHVLAQDMVHQSERRRLLVFCDNRQDAAFQAGWMKDHARRFRLRSLMADGLADGHRSVGDLTWFLEGRTGEERGALSRADPGGLGRGPPGGSRPTPPRGAAQVPAHAGAARDLGVRPATPGAGALGPNEGRLRRPGRLAAVDPGPREPARATAGIHAGGGRRGTRLRAPAEGPPRRGVQDVHQELARRRPGDSSRATCGGPAGRRASS